MNQFLLFAFIIMTTPTAYYGLGVDAAPPSTDDSIKKEDVNSGEFSFKLNDIEDQAWEAKDNEIARGVQLNHSSTENPASWWTRSLTMFLWQAILIGLIILLILLLLLLFCCCCSGGGEAGTIDGGKRDRGKSTKGRKSTKARKSTKKQKPSTKSGRRSPKSKMCKSPKKSTRSAAQKSQGSRYINGIKQGV